MVKNLLLPHRFKKIGWWLLAAAAAAFIVKLSLSPAANGYIRFAAVSLTFLFAFSSITLLILSKEKVEDEMILSLRMQSFMLAVYLLLATQILWTIYWVYSWGLLLFLIHIKGDFTLIPILPGSVASIYVLFAVYLLIFHFRLWQQNRVAKNKNQ